MSLTTSVRSALSRASHAVPSALAEYYTAWRQSVLRATDREVSRHIPAGAKTVARALSETALYDVHGWRLSDVAWALVVLWRLQSGAYAHAPNRWGPQPVPDLVSSNGGLAVNRSGDLERAVVVSDVLVISRTVTLLRLAQASYSASDDELLAFMGYEPGQVIARNFLADANLFHPAFLVCIDHDLKAVVVSIRGTYSWSDALINFTTATEPLAGGTVHRGMLFTARRMADVLRHLNITRVLADHPGYGFHVVGHSLGGGVAALLAILMKLEVPAIRGHAFCAPACTSRDVASACAPYVTSYVNGADVTSRFHLESAEALRAQIHGLSLQRAVLDSIPAPPLAIQSALSAVAGGVATVAGGVATAAAAGAGVARWTSSQLYHLAPRWGGGGGGGGDVVNDDVSVGAGGGGEAGAQLSEPALQTHDVVHLVQEAQGQAAGTPHTSVNNHDDTASDAAPSVGQPSSATRAVASGSRISGEGWGSYILREAWDAIARDGGGTATASVTASPPSGCSVTVGTAQSSLPPLPASPRPGIEGAASDVSSGVGSDVSAPFLPGVRPLDGDVSGGAVPLSTAAATAAVTHAADVTTTTATSIEVDDATAAAVSPTQPSSTFILLDDDDSYGSEGEEAARVAASLFSPYEGGPTFAAIAASLPPPPQPATEGEGEGENDALGSGTPLSRLAEDAYASVQSESGGSSLDAEPQAGASSEGAAGAATSTVMQPSAAAPPNTILPQSSASPRIITPHSHHAAGSTAAILAHARERRLDFHLPGTIVYLAYPPGWPRGGETTSAPHITSGAAASLDFAAMAAVAAVGPLPPPPAAVTATEASIGTTAAELLTSLYSRPPQPSSIRASRRNTAAINPAHSASRAGGGHDGRGSRSETLTDVPSPFPSSSTRSSSANANTFVYDGAAIVSDPAPANGNGGYYAADPYDGGEGTRRPDRSPAGEAEALAGYMGPVLLQLDALPVQPRGAVADAGLLRGVDSGVANDPPPPPAASSVNSSSSRGNGQDYRVGRLLHPHPHLHHTTTSSSVATPSTAPTPDSPEEVLVAPSAATVFVPQHPRHSESAAPVAAAHASPHKIHPQPQVTAVQQPLSATPYAVPAPLPSSLRPQPQPHLPVPHPPRRFGTIQLSPYMLNDHWASSFEVQLRVWLRHAHDLAAARAD